MLFLLLSLSAQVPTYALNAKILDGMGDFCTFEALKRQEKHNKKSPAMPDFLRFRMGLNQRPHD